MARELEAVTDAAPDGQVLAVGEAAAVRLGRELTRRRAWRPPCSGRPRPPRKRGSRARLPLRRPPLVKDKAARTAVTAAGRVSLRRRSLRCGGCGLTAYPADDRVGLDGFLSPGATRLACLAAASWSFDVASDRLDEFAGVRIDDETIRRHVHRAAGRPGARAREAAPPSGLRRRRGGASSSSPTA